MQEGSRAHTEGPGPGPLWLPPALNTLQVFQHQPGRYPVIPFTPNPNLREALEAIQGSVLPPAWNCPPTVKPSLQSPGNEA